MAGEHEHIDAMREFGFNRLSMGVQDFTPEVQAIISRYPLTPTGGSYQMGRSQKVLVHTPDGAIAVWNVHPYAPLVWSHQYQQIAAIAAHGNRRPALEALDLPALVIHGADDPLVRVEGGHDTHQALKGSKLRVVEGMGHDLPEALWPEIVEAIDDLTRST